MRDLRDIRMYCRAKEWLQKHGVDWDDFMRNGVDISVLENGDALGRLAAKKIRTKNGR